MHGGPAYETHVTHQAVDARAGFHGEREQLVHVLLAEHVAQRSTRSGEEREASPTTAPPRRSPRACSAQ